MKYGILFAGAGLVLVLQAVMRGGLWWALAWPGASFSIVGAAYLGLGPCVFGKRLNGTMAWHAVAGLLPYLLLSWLTWHLIRATSKEDCSNEVTPGLLIGRRPLAGELPEKVAMVVDLTAEFPEPAHVRAGREYISLPMLDAGTVCEDALAAVVGRIVQSSGPVYIHCAQGHGRTGTLAAAVLVARGQAATVDEAVQRLREVRPGLELSRRQIAFLQRVHRARKALP